MLADRSLMTYDYYIERGNTSITNAAQRQELKMKIRNNKKPFDIPSFSESLKKDYEAGTIELKEAAIEFYKANWTAFVDIEYTKKQFGIK
ncbi:hypothetical protein [Escherichia coli]|uniref:hypothetical protein n=1 Tax=Escherichia coli TaxID=562 RepID=UPI0013642DD7|nr:hypothetical protein [Escherichia coli]